MVFYSLVLCLGLFSANLFFFNKSNLLTTVYMKELIVTLAQFLFLTITFFNLVSYFIYSM